MFSKHDKRASLHDIVENAGRVQRHLANMDREAFEEADLVRDAVERCVERVCEAVHRLGSEAEALMPGQPWASIRGMANRLRHAYDRIDVDMVWYTAQSDIPRLQAAAVTALAQLADGEDPAVAPGNEAKDRTQ